jgi:glutamyl-tRNA synthetase
VISSLAPLEYDAKASKNWKEETTPLMHQLITVLKEIEDFKSIIEKH